MEQKMNSKSLREMYFNSRTAENSFNPDDLPTQQVRQPSGDERAYRKFNADEINHFESIFNQHHKQSKQSKVSLTPLEPVPTPTEKVQPAFHDQKQPTSTPWPDLTSFVDLPKASSQEQEKANVEEERVKLPIVRGQTLGQVFDKLVAEEAKVQATEKEVVSPLPIVDHGSTKDLDYLNALVTNHPIQSGPADAHSIGDIFDEIVGNEQNNTVNYCSKTFDANVQNLFDEDPEEELKTPPKQMKLPEENFFLEEEDPFDKKTQKKQRNETKKQRKLEKKKSKAFDFIDILLLILIFAFLGILGYLIMARF